MAKALVIVESPAKAKTIAGYLGDDFVVESSIGHVRDLPENASQVPKAYRGESWARMGVDVDNDFKPIYVVSTGKRSQIAQLKSRLSQVDELYLATDEDREGESIAWHLIEVLNPKVPVKRMVFHEITRDAIRAAISQPRELDRRLVDAQEARRIFDRLYGFEVSPVLWKKILPRLSAGRVQSVAIRIVVERERERMAFVAADYWALSGNFTAAQGQATRDRSQEFEATLVTLDGAGVAVGADFGPDGQVRSARRTNRIVLDEAAAASLVSDLEGVDYTVQSRESKPYRRRPPAPFVTSSFQQAAGNKLHMSASAAMRAAQSLYEKGFITYMRTDSTTLSESALRTARKEIAERYGTELLPPAARVYTKKVKNAQEAHEAIRPAGDSFQAPEAVAHRVSKSEAAAYELIWQRTLASQMTDCTGETVKLRLAASSHSGRRACFAASGTVITHQGFRQVYQEDRAGSDATDERRLPPLNSGDMVRCTELRADPHQTKPPPRYTEASLVGRLEELGVGRPSTYASTIDKIYNRGYVWKKRSALVPSFTAFSVVNLLEHHFPKLVDYALTAEMEDDLDKIARGVEESVPWLSRFYFGHADDPGLREKVSSRLSDIDARTINSVQLGEAGDGSIVEARAGRYGPYVQRGDDFASVPEDLCPDELTVAKALELLDQTRSDRVVGRDPETGLQIRVKTGRFGPFVQLGSDSEVEGKPRRSSLLSTMDIETVTLDDALQLLSLPRTVGVDPADGATITAQNGRYGPYLKKGSETRSLEREEQLLTITLEEALAVLARPKLRRGQVERPALRELGPEPATGRQISIKDGRYGPYVTDGEVNASLRKGDLPAELSLERASELLADRRARGSARKPAARKKPAAKRPAARKKPAAKRPAARKKPTAP